MIKIDSKELLIHVLLVVLSLLFLNNPSFDLTFGVFNSGDGSLIWPSVYGTLFNLFIFYGISFYFIPFVLRKRGKGFFWVAILTFCGIVTVIETSIDATIFERIRGSQLDKKNWEEILIMVTSVHVLFIMISFAYRFSKDWFSNEELRKKIGEWQTQSELQILKSQINPHFLFNALNSLFSMALKNGDDTTAEGIAKLSDMMRYVLEGNGKESILISDEVSYIKNYIFLQQLRFEDHLNITTQYDASCSHKVAPMLFIPFIENAFKYGVSTQRKTAIDIDLTCDENNIHFQCVSELVQSKEAIESYGIGIKNVIKRLKLIYPQKHEIEYGEKEGRYIVKLSLNV